MRKTGQQIEDDVYSLVRNGSLAAAISGGTYKFGMRPRDSRLEDATVRFVTGLDGQIQIGTVVVDVYVPDMDAYGNGSLVRDISRCAEIEAAANAWVQSLSTAGSDYLFELAQMIYTEEEPEIGQHFVSVRLRFRFFGN